MNRLRSTLRPSFTAALVTAGTLAAAGTVGLLNPEAARAHEHITVHHGMCGWSVVSVSNTFYDSMTDTELGNGTVDEDSGTRWLGHFWNPKLDTAPSFSLGSGKAPDNSKIQWDFAVAEYANGNFVGVDAAFHRLGRAIHYLQDMTSPPHVHDDPHPPGDPSDFEDWGPTAFPDYDLASVVPKFATPPTPHGYLGELANLTYDRTAYDVELDEQAGAQVASEYNSMFPSLVFVDGGIFGDDRWEVDRVGCHGCVFGDDWWVEDFGYVTDSGGRGGTTRILGTAYVESTGGGTGLGDPIPLVWNGIDNSVDQKTLRELYGDHLYPDAVAYGAGMMLDFQSLVQSTTCGDGVLDAGEQCDTAGAADDCCTDLCRTALASTVCRAPASACDAPEVCDGSTINCPADVVAEAGVECRAAAGDCDVVESCDGVSADCPADALATQGTECRAVAGSCDLAEECDGSSADCPADAVEEAGTPCRSAAGECDLAESCDGSAAACPGDAAVAAGASCSSDGEACTDDECDGAGSCTHTFDPTNGPGCTTTTTLPSLPQNRDQQKCIVAFNKAAAKVGQAQTAETARCLGDAAAGDSADAEACSAADEKGKVAKATWKVTKVQDKKCPTTPDFGPAVAADVSTEAISGARTLQADVFGADLQAAVTSIATDRDVIRCQTGAVKSYDKLTRTAQQIFGQCKKKGLASGAIVNRSGLEACLDEVTTDARGKMAKAAAKILQSLEKRCNPAGIAAAFPGACSGEVDLSALTDCLTVQVRCRLCTGLNEVDGMQADCDLFDDDTANSSCP